MPKTVSVQKEQETIEFFKGAETIVEGNKQLKQLRDGKYIMTQAQDDWVDIDVAMPDAVEIGKKIDKDNEALEEIRNKLKAIEDELGKPLPAFSEQKGVEEHKTEVNQQNLLLIEKYNELVDSCNNALENGGLKEEEISQVQDIKEKVEKERNELPESILRFRQIISRTDKKSKSRQKVRTFGDALRFQRGEYYDLDSANAKFSIGGAGTSKLYIIENGDKKLYFKGEENSFDDEKLAEHVAKIADKNPGLPQEFVNDLVKHLSVDAKIMEKFYGHFVDELVSNLRFKHRVISSSSKLKASPKNESERLIINMFNSASKEEKELIRDFVVDFGTQYRSSVISNHSALIKMGNNISRRNAATSRMATLLGMDDMVAQSRNATILHNNSVIQGNIMDEAKNVKEYELSTATYSDRAVDQLLSLQLLDLVCGQIDRHAGNYTKTLNKYDQIDNIAGIDNDMSFGEISFDKLITHHTVRGISIQSFVLMPQQVKEKVKSLDEERIRLQFMDLITPKEIDALVQRIKDIKLVLKYVENKIKKMDKNERMILEDPELGKKWMLYTMSLEEEDPQTKPTTYLQDKYMKDPVVLRNELISALKKKKMMKIPFKGYEHLADLE